MKSFFVSLALVLVLVSSILCCFVESALGAPIVLRFSTHLSAKDAFVAPMVEGLNEIEKRTNGAVKFEKFFDGTLIGVRDSWEELIKGTADIVSIAAHHSPGEKVLPLYLTINDGWIGIKDLRKQVRIQKQLLKEFAELAAEWSAVKPLSLHGLGELRLHTKKRIRGLADFKGLQLRGVGSWPKYTVEKLGGSLVALPSAELYIALQKGIIDGTFLDDSVLLTFKLAEVTPYTLDLGGVLPGVNTRMCMNLNSWKRLSPDVQKIFEEVGDFISDRYIQLREESLKGALAFAKEKKHEFITLPPQDLKRLHELLKEEISDRIKKLDARGLPATKVFNRMQELMKQ